MTTYEKVRSGIQTGRCFQTLEAKNYHKGLTNRERAERSRKSRTCQNPLIKSHQTKNVLCLAWPERTMEQTGCEFALTPATSPSYERNRHPTQTLGLFVSGLA